jgi:hypothetical protein
LDGIVDERMVASKLNFFLIGAPKAGTTLIHSRLSEHAQVYLSPLKEPNHFATDIDPAGFSPAFKANLPGQLDRYFGQKPLKSRQVGFVSDLNQYATLFDQATPQHKVVGECSTSYLWSTEAAENVAQAHPQAKILVALRNPLDRLFSHWQMARKYGFTDAPLLEAVRDDQAHPNPGWGKSELFVEAGQYASGLRRWQARFPEANIKVVLNASLNDPATWQGLADWLGLDGPIPGGKNIPANPAGMARMPGLNHWLTQSGIKATAARVLPSGFKKKLASRWYTTKGLPKMSQEERAALWPFFEQDIKETESLTGLDLSHWQV